jgi:outer membrane protein assembly factor BamB
MFRGNLLRDGRATNSTISASNVGSLNQVWSHDLDGPIESSPVVVGHTVIALTRRGDVAAFDIATGSAIWSHTGFGDFAGSPAVAGGLVLAGSLTGHVYAFVLTDGRTRWDWTAPGQQPAIWSSPAVFGQMVVVGIGSQYGDSPLEPGRVVGLDLATGSQKWSFCVEAGCAPGGGVWSSAAIDAAGRGIVGTGNPNDGLLAFDVASGRVLWATSLHPDDGRDLDVGATPVIVVSGGRESVAVGSDGGLFAMLDASGGTIIWQRFLVPGSAVHGLIASPAYDGTSFFVGSASPPTGLFALDPKTGEIQWEHDTDLPVYAAPVVSSQVLFFGIGDAQGTVKGGKLIAVSATDGGVLWSFDTQDPVLGSPAISGKYLVTGTAGGALTAFSA